MSDGDPFRRARRGAWKYNTGMTGGQVPSHFLTLGPRVPSLRSTTSADRRPSCVRGLGHVVDLQHKTLLEEGLQHQPPCWGVALPRDSFDGKGRPIDPDRTSVTRIDVLNPPSPYAA